MYTYVLVGYSRSTVCWIPVPHTRSVFLCMTVKKVYDLFFFKYRIYCTTYNCILNSIMQFFAYLHNTTLQGSLTWTVSWLIMLCTTDIRLSKDSIVNYFYKQKFYLSMLYTPHCYRNYACNFVLGIMNWSGNDSSISDLTAPRAANRSTMTEKRRRSIVRVIFIIFVSTVFHINNNVI